MKIIDKLAFVKKAIDSVATHIAHDGKVLIAALEHLIEYLQEKIEEVKARVEAEVEDALNGNEKDDE